MMMDSRQPTATLTVARGPEVGRRFGIGATTVTIGRYGECDIQMRDSWVSRWHARVSWNGIEYIVEDLGSTNGTYVNGQRVGAPRALRPGDHLQLGEQVEFVFQVGVSVPSSQVALPAGIRPSPGRIASPSQAMPTFTKSIAEQKGSPNRRRRIGIWVLVASICLLVLILGGGAYYLVSDSVKATATPTPVVTPSTPVLLRSLTEFEQSPFCKEYGCRFSDSWALRRGGTNNSYKLSSAPSVTVGVTTVDGVPEDFGLSLYDRPSLSPDDLDMIDMFLSAAHPGVPITSETQDYIAKSTQKSLFQICEATPHEFGLLKVWAGKVINPVVHVGKTCPE